MEQREELIRTMLGMLRDLHENYGWDELSDTLEGVAEAASDLGVTLDE